jgi:hypothetical protein
VVHTPKEVAVLVQDAIAMAGSKTDHGDDRERGVLS